jgi:AcrR family transcriptional regulator
MKSTKQRVLDMSADMFNRYGIEAVSFGQIAEALKISPGNLTYHFKKKTDLIGTHITDFEQRLKESVESLPPNPSPEIFTAAYINLLELTLQYRFLFIGANYIIQNDLVSVDRYDELIDTTKSSFIKQISQLAMDGLIKPIHAPYNIEMLVDGIWWQWLGWLLAMQIRPPVKHIWDDKVLVEGALHILFISHHFLDEPFYQAVQEQLKNRSKPRKKKSAAKS